jgi:hypothetical protein
MSFFAPGTLPIFTIALRKISLLCSSHGWGSCSSESLSHLPNVTTQISGRARIRMLPEFLPCVLIFLLLALIPLLARSPPLTTLPGLCIPLLGAYKVPLMYCQSPVCSFHAHFPQHTVPTGTGWCPITVFLVPPAEQMLSKCIWVKLKLIWPGIPWVQEDPGSQENQRISSHRNLGQGWVRGREGAMINHDVWMMLSGVYLLITFSCCHMRK